MGNARRLGAGTLVLAVLMVTLCGAPLRAISFLGDRGGECFTLGAGGTHVITMTNGTTVGSTLLAIGMISAGGAAAVTPVQDSRANSWVLVHTFNAANGTRLFVYETRIAPGKNHSAGDTVTLSFSGANGQKSCSILSNWSGLVAPSSVDRMNGASGTSAAPTVSTNGATTQTNEVLIAAFGFTAATGGFTYHLPLNPLSGACDAPHCMFPGWTLLPTIGSYSALPTTANVTNWSGLLITLKGDNTVFSDGFENSTSSNWSSTVG
ncbi:MAG: hypothetical protein ABI639_13025 [Thermoanaerobaculia bacterium]